MKVKTCVKVCGITHKDDAHHSVALGARWLGIVFAPRSPKYVSPEEARVLVQESPSGAAFVGVFVDEEPRVVLDIVKEVGLQKVQLQGSETPELCRALNNVVPVIKAFRVDERLLEDPQQPERYMEVEAHLFDSRADSVEGGGVFDWRLLARVSRCKPRVLAGGLNERNIVEAIRVVRPDAVDLSSSLAKPDDPRRKDAEKMQRFFQTLGRVDRA